MLSEVIFNAAGLSAGSTLAAGNFASNAGGTPTDNNDYILYNTTTGALSYDADCNGAGLAQLFATLTENPLLVAADVHVGLI